MLTDDQIREALRPLCKDETALDMLLKTSMDEYRAIEAAVLAEAAKDREDAERYRWLRDRSAWTLMSANGILRLAHRLPTGFKPTPQENGDDYDAAIDAARGKP